MVSDTNGADSGRSSANEDALFGAAATSAPVAGGAPALQVQPHQWQCARPACLGVGRGSNRTRSLWFLPIGFLNQRHSGKAPSAGIGTIPMMMRSPQGLASNRIPPVGNGMARAMAHGMKSIREGLRRYATDSCTEALRLARAGCFDLAADPFGNSSTISGGRRHALVRALAGSPDRSRRSVRLPSTQNLLDLSSLC